MTTRDNRNQKRTFAAAPALAAALLLILLAPAALADEPTPQDFAGSWQLNTELSDMPAAALPPGDGEAAPVGRGRGGMGRGGQGGGMNPAGVGRGAGRGGRGGAMASSGRPRGAGRSMGQGVMILGVAPDALTVTKSNEITHSMKLDGESHEIDTPRGKVQMKARWQAGRYLVETAHPNGGTISREYSLSEDGKQLTILTQRPDPRSGGVVTTREVFDRQED